MVNVDSGKNDERSMDILVFGWETKNMTLGKMANWKKI